MEDYYILNRFLNENGLTKSESDIYIFLLKYGRQPVSIIAKRLGFKRTSCYTYIEKLKVKNFVKAKNINGLLIVEAIDLEFILNRVHENLFEQYSKNVNRINHLRSLKPKLVSSVNYFDEPEIITYTGSDALKKIYEEGLDTDFILAYFATAYDDPSQTEIDNFYTQKRVELGIPIKILLQNNDSAKKFAEIPLPKKETKIIDTKEVPFEGVTIIVRNKVLIFSEQTNEGICIKSPVIAKNHARFFNLVWDSVS